MLLDIGNLELTQGESSDRFEITSNDSLEKYKAILRISKGDGVALHESELEKTPEVLNNDNIFDEDTILSYNARMFDYKGNINDSKPDSETFEYDIKIDSISKDKLTEKATIKGTIFKSEVKDTLNPPNSGGGTQTPDSSQTQTPDSSQTTQPTAPSTRAVQTNVLYSVTTQIPIENAEVELILTAPNKEISRSIKCYSDDKGEFTAEIFLGSTIKAEKNRGFIFEISNEVTEKVGAGRFYCIVNIVKEELDGTISYSKEIIRTKIEINQKL